ncbi:exonuclease SbcCD subunit D [Bifidobacterium vansinderenii]|uniref:Nuclease SbcCD subunit D n=1 Tax=Bifidobacterium vansinderenii TaxID=1984871 RepID=A0A229VVH8_9BIFI|nr:exonuclease SbcCD subunit D C-terminal domain-containing protein [Bifidobacterium vansinderenii]OXM99618.1 exonuclease sbcCD subunit D [Bifidobacterium vansinderenii]
MRILHTSDWHIGRRFKGLDLSEYQRRALDWLVDTVRREHVDVVCVSGDVYDSPMPSAASVDLLDDVLTRLTALTDDEGRPAVDVIVTPGNHDSARKLGFGSRMMRPNLHLRCDTARLAEPVIVTRGSDTGEERLAVYALPYLDPDAARPALEKLLAEDSLRNSGDTPETSAAPDGIVHNKRNSGDNAPNETESRRSDPDAAPADQTDTDEHPDPDPNACARIPRSHEGVMTAAMRLIRADLQRRRAEAIADGVTFRAVLMAHAFVSGASPSDSERAITVGGVDSVPAAVFSDSGLDYLALGHLHRAQQVRIPAVQAGAPTDGTIAAFAVVSTDTPADAATDSLTDVKPVSTATAAISPAPPIARYAGSLLAYSFSEACVPPAIGNGKSVAIVDLPAESAASRYSVTGVSADPTASDSIDPGITADSDNPNNPNDANAHVAVRTLPVESGQPALVQLKGSPDDLLGDLAAEHRHDWVSLTVVADAYPHGMYQKLDVAYEHALEKNFEITRRTDRGGIGDGHDRTMANLHETRNELDVLEGFVRYTLGRDPNDDELAVLRDAVERVHAVNDDAKDSAKSRGNADAKSEKGVRA